MFKKKVQFKKGVPGEALLVVLLIIFVVLLVLFGGSVPLIGVLVLAFALIIKRLYFGKLKLYPADLVLFWGLPGSGKTLFATKTAYDNKDDWYIGVNPEFEHLQLKDFDYTRDSLVNFTFPGAALFYDEGSLNGFDNREFKTNFKDPGMLETFKKHRQMDFPLVFTNQGFEELDLKIRGPLSTHVYYVENMGFWCRATLMIPDVTISEIDGKPQEGYRFPGLLERFIDPSVQLYAWKSFYGKFYNTCNPPLRLSFPPLEAARKKRTVSRGVPDA